ncbi:HAD-IA family hydrolase [Cytophagaceae bacterium SJW1-29]|uniref:HAD-IA family hydrolase n=1 Tax=Salmonirosea aquatica TaxID=2654236 RepID=A0A7C9B7N0_9BACT|nr:HAD-IA family hydrolase [Cytophagaceae bacterium SJW1-29]
MKNIIFDLGDVIINIDVPRAAQSFATLSGRSTEEIVRLFEEGNLFRQFETGALDADGFRSYVREILNNTTWADVEVDTAWNSLLLDIPAERIELIRKLSKDYRLFLLSNTSSIHIEAVDKILHQASGAERLGDLFEKVFLSYEMGVMKPHPEIYQRVLTEADLLPDETLFLDDNLDNIHAARLLGIQTIHVQKPLSILDYLNDYVD